MRAGDSSGPSGFGAHWLARTELADQGEIVTFYSYKGGTGRSMALVNCGGLIAQQLPGTAKPVLLIDFDLEAPGLHRYLAPFLPASAAGLRQGVLDLFEALRAKVDETLPREGLQPGEKPRLDDETAARVVDEIDLSPYIIETTVTGLRLIVAGQFDDEYDKRLARFGWEALYEKAPALFRCLSERLAREHSFAFIDSRTGLSDTGGICTMLMPTALVMVFTPNTQSITGIKHLVRKAVDYRARGSDSRELRVYPLPSRVDNQVEHFRQVWRMGDANNPLFGAVEGYQPMFQGVFESDLQMRGTDQSKRLAEYFDVVQVPHSADYAYGERLCFTSTALTDSLSIRSSYEQFLPWLVTGAQPWQRPADALADHRASLWLHEAGADQAPDPSDDETADATGGWTAWFEHLSALVDNSQGLPTESASLSLDRQFDVSVAMALAHAWRDEFAASRECVGKARSAWHKDLDSILPVAAPAELVRLWAANRSTASLSVADRRLWLEDVERLMLAWQPLRTQRRAWLFEMAGLAAKAGWLETERWALEQLVAVIQQTLGEEHIDTLSATIDLASVLRAQGDLAGARALQERTVAISERLLGADHLYTLVATNNLAGTLRALGDVSSALDLQERTLDLSRRTLGDEASFTLVAMTNLAGTRRAKGDLIGARDLQQAVVSVSRRVLGDDAPDTLAAMNNLAGTLLRQDDLSGARALQETILDICTKALGPERPETLAAMSNLAGTIQAQGDLSSARDLQFRTLEIRRRVLGDAHPETLSAMNNLADTLQALGELSAARELQERTLEGRQRVLGEEHADTLTTMGNLARTFVEQGDVERARELLTRTLEIRRRVLGDAHPALLNEMNNLAVVFQRMGNVDGALALQQSMLDLSVRTLGEHDPLTLSVMNNLATTLRGLNRLPDAYALQEKALSIGLDALGEEHIETLRAMNGLGIILQEQGERDRAYALFNRAWTILRRVRGSDDTETWTVGILLGTLALELENATRAAEVLDASRVPVLTTDNAHWLGLRMKVAEKLGDRQEVARYQRRLNELLTRSPSKLR